MNPLELLYDFPNKLAGLLTLLRAEKHRRGREAANYFNELAETLNAMIVKLRKREVPREEGHKFQVLIHAFEEKTKRLKKDVISSELAEELQIVSQKAEILDGALLIYLPDVEEQRLIWLHEMERMVGDFRGIAAVLESGT